MIQVEIHTAEIPSVFRRFCDVIGERYWRKRVSGIKAEIRGNRFLKDYLAEENAIAYALDRCSDLTARYGQIPQPETQNRALYPAFSFAVQVLSMVDRSSSEQSKQIVQRVRGAFQNPDDMRAIQLELTAATHFARRGYSMTWPEMEGVGQFDLLIEDIGINGLEVECKSVSQDKGRKIHRREALEFYHLISPHLKVATQNLKSGLAVILTVPSRLPKSLGQRQELGKQIIDQILSAQNKSFGDGIDIRISEFDAALLGGSGSGGRPAITRSVLDQVTATRNREVMVIGNQVGGAIALVLQSANDDTLLKYVFNTLSQSAKTQLTKNRPAIFLVGLHDLDANELVGVAGQDSDHQQPPTALRIAASDFLSSQDRDHVVGVAFLSRGSLIPKPHDIVEIGGSVYFFPKRENRFWHQDFNTLFYNGSF